MPAEQPGPRAVDAERGDRVDEVPLAALVDPRGGLGDLGIAAPPGPDRRLGRMRQADPELGQRGDPQRRVGLRLRDRDEPLAVLALPVLEQLVDEAGHAAEMVVEGALRDLEALAQHRDRHRLAAVLAEHGERLAEVVLGRQPLHHAIPPSPPDCDQVLITGSAGTAH